MRNSSSLDWLRFMHTPNDYRVSPIIRCFKFGSISHLHYIKNSTDAINNPNVAVEKPRDEVDAPVLYVLI
jgi:hypothetical protein